MTVTHKNRLVTTVSAVASAGLGAFTISAASSGYRTFAAGDDGKTFDVLITEGTAWEVRTGCAYTHSGTTLARGTLEDSSTGSAIAFTSACIVTQSPTADWGQRLERAMQSVMPGGRLTLTSGTPVTTSDVTGATSIYYTPYVHDTVPLWDGARWVPTTFAETTLALGTLTSAKNYDIFGYLSSGALALEVLAWTDDTTRATAVTQQDGRYCKSGDKTRLLLGSFRTTSTTTTEDSAGGTASQTGGKRFLWNAYNRVRRHAAVIDTTDSWSYTTDTVRQANAASGNKVEFLAGLSLDPVRASVSGISYLQGVSTKAAKVGVGIDSTTVMSGLRQGGLNPDSASGIYAPVSAAYYGFPGVGYHYAAWLEKGGSPGTCLFLGDNAADDQQAGLQAEVYA